MRVLVSRAPERAEGTARALRDAGHAPLVAPMLSIEASGRPPPQVAATALVVTSAAAVSAAGNRLAGLLHLPAFAVGPKTADALRRAGFARVTASDGDAGRLARAVAAALPAGSVLLHLAGRHRRPEPARGLEAAGLTVAAWEVYEARAVEQLPPDAARALASGEIDAVLHYSRRSAEILVRLAGEAGLSEALARSLHLCLSGEIARGLAGLAPARIVLASAPNEGALLAALTQAAGSASAGREARTPTRRW